MRGIAFACAAVCAAAFVSACQCPCGGEFGVNSKRAEIEAVRAPGEVKIDGVIDPREWAGAKEYTFAKAADADDLNPQIPAKFRRSILSEKFQSGKVRLMYDKQYLYIAASFDDSDVMQSGHESQTHLYSKGDTFEMFLKPENGESYWELYATPESNHSSFFFVSRGYPGFDSKDYYHRDMKVAAKVLGTLNKYKDTDKGWDVEVAVPISMIEETGVKFDASQPWTVLLARYNYNYGNRKGSPQNTTVPRLPQANFHLTEYYGKLILK